MASKMLDRNQIPPEFYRGAIEQFGSSFQQERLRKMLELRGERVTPKELLSPFKQKEESLNRLADQQEQKTRRYERGRAAFEQAQTPEGRRTMTPEQAEEADRFQRQHGPEAMPELKPRELRVSQDLKIAITPDYQAQEAAIYKAIEVYNRQLLPKLEEATQRAIRENSGAIMNEMQTRFDIERIKQTAERTQ